MTYKPLPRREDWGFFGPGSPTWKVWGYGPTGLLAFQRSIVVESFDPFLAAAVEDQNGVREYAQSRFNHTLAYFLTVAVADTRTALRASDVLMRIHDRAQGTEPVTQRPYSANDPDSQLWIHITGWHSNLLMYERYGPGPLSAAEQDQFWAESAVAAELQTCDPAKVPRSRADVRDYYADVRRRLCMTEHARALIHYFLRSDRSLAGTKLWLGSRFMAPAVIATIPRWMRVLGGFDQPRALDRAIAAPARALTRAAARPTALLAAVDRLAPAVRPVMEQKLYGEPPIDPVTLTPAEARQKWGSHGGRDWDAAAAALRKVS
ncbi:oxygenase MpaB family protein [Streptomyces sp. NPDC059009]|uniref:oxygenase MpaB family protein n=1 Tax=Streptomyces sp. NPDC059009 TaxID=3346694 RepID=UPI0036A7EBB8